MFIDLNFLHHWTWFLFVFFSSQRCICHLDFAKGDVKKGILTLIVFLSCYKEVHAKCFLCTLFKSIEQPVGAALVAQTIKNLPAMQEPQVQSLGWEDLLEWGMATHSSILAWRIPWTEEPGRLQFMRSQRTGHNWGTKNSAADPGASTLSTLSLWVKNGGFSFKTGD